MKGYDLVKLSVGIMIIVVVVVFFLYIIFIEIYHLQSSYNFIDNIIYRLK